MYLLYLDDAGSAPNRNERYLVLGGLAVFEAHARWITSRLDRLASVLDPENPDAVEFHASEIFSGRTPPWNSLSREGRKQIIHDVLDVLVTAPQSCHAFACAVHKDSFTGADPMHLAFEDLCSRFNIYLCHTRTARGTDERGLIILDQSSHETSLQKLARRFRHVGTRWSSIRRMADTPLFIDSRSSRLVQLADHIAYAVYRRYEAGDTSYFDIFANRFFVSQSVVHGLAHKQTTEMNASCMCPACLSRRKAA